MEGMMTENTYKPLISIIVPVYNVEPYIHSCIDSILHQTYHKLEIILIISPSPDNCGAICDEYENNDERVVVIRRARLGLSDARNAGIEVSNGDYLAFVDGDDYIAPNFIEVLYNIIQTHECDIAQCHYLCVPAERDEIKITKTKKVTLYSNREMCLNLFNQKIPSTTTWNKLYQRKLFGNIRFPVGRIHEDVATTHQLIYIANKIGVTKQPLYYYRQINTSITGQQYNLKRLDNIWACEERVRYFREKEEHQLYILSLYACLICIYTSRLNVKKYIIDSKEIQHCLMMREHNVYQILKNETCLSSSQKIIAIFLIKYPTLIELLLKIKHSLAHKYI